MPFQVVCTSCESILEVQNPELIGQIVACPKCGSMVLIEMPAVETSVAETLADKLPIPEPPPSKPSRKKAAKKTIEQPTEPATKKSSTPKKITTEKKTAAPKAKRSGKVSTRKKTDQNADNEGDLPQTVLIPENEAVTDVITNVVTDIVADMTFVEPLANSVADTLTVGNIVDAETTLGDETLGPLAAELQEKYLKDVPFEDWQKRRLIIVGVGTCCLLLTFFAFLFYAPKYDRMSTIDGGQVTPDQKTTETAQESAPQPPGGIEKTRTAGQANDQTTDRTDVASQGMRPGTDVAEHGGLPPADQIKVESPSSASGETTETQQSVVAPIEGQTDQQRSGVEVAPPPGAGQTDVGGRSTSRPDVVRVEASPSEIFIDPFGDIFDNENGGGSQNGRIWGDDSSETPGNVAVGDGTTDSVQNGSTSPTDDGFDGMLGNGQTAVNVTEIAIIPTGNSEQDNRGSDGDAIDEKTVMRPDVHVTPGDIEGTVDSLKQTIAISPGRQKIDIAERLQLPVASMRFEKTPVIDVVRAISDLSGVPIQLDVDELRARGISVESPVSLQLTETTLDDIVDAVLQKTRLTRYDRDNYIVLGYTDEQVTATRTVRYGMSQLATLAQNPISPEQAAQWLSDLLIDQPQNPKARDAVVAVDGNEIVIVGTIWLQDQARRLLLSLFYMREIEPETKLTPEKLAPEVFGWDRVNAGLSFNLVAPMPLKQAARLIEGHTKMRLLIDHAALQEEGLSLDTHVVSHVSNGTIDSVLREMLEPLGLTYRIVEANAVEITTPKIACEKMTVEAQHYAPLLSGNKTPESIAETMRQVFGGNDRWDAKTGGTIVIDTVSGYMLVRQSQPLQRDIRLWFGRLNSEIEQEDNTETDGNSETDDDFETEIDATE